MKKTLFYICFLLLLPQITLASWWNPFSWFNNWTFSEPTQITQVDVLEDRIKELEDKLEASSLPNSENANGSSSISTTTVITDNNSEAENISTPEEKQAVITSPQITKPILVPTSVVTQTPVVIDICSNIQGIQMQVPSGYSVTSNICEQIYVEDKCKNIEGVQAEVPDGYLLYKNETVIECLSEWQIEVIEQKKSEEQAVINAEQEAEDHENEVRLKIARWDTISTEIGLNKYARDPNNTECNNLDGCPYKEFPPELEELVKRLYKEGLIDSSYTPHVIQNTFKSVLYREIGLETTRLHEDLYK